MLKLRIEPILPIIRQSDRAVPKSKVIATKNERKEEQKIIETTTQRKTLKSRNNQHISVKNEEDVSNSSFDNSYHGRKCYCCSHGSDDSSGDDSPKYKIKQAPKKRSLFRNGDKSQR